MYITEFCDDPDNIIILETGRNTFDDSIFREYQEKLKALDRYMYLVDAYEITIDCSSDLKGIIPQSQDAFWKVNKCLLNYVNAIYCYHEFVNSYNPPLGTIANKYYYDKNGKFWYRFVCDYRNRVVHQSVILRDFDAGNGDIFIDLDELIEEQNKIISDLRKKPKEISNARRFLQKITTLANTPHRVRDGRRLWSMKVVAKLTDQEITDMSNEILLHAFRKAIQPVFEWLLSLMHSEGGIPKYTFIVNKDVKDSELEPNYTLEWYFRKIVRSMGKNNNVCREMRELLISRRYTNFYDGNCDIDEFINICCGDR